MIIKENHVKSIYPINLKINFLCNHMIKLWNRLGGKIILAIISGLIFGYTPLIMQS